MQNFRLFLHMCLRCSYEFACIIFTKLRGGEVNEWTNANYIDVLQASITEKRYNRRATQSCNVYLCKNLCSYVARRQRYARGHKLQRFQREWPLPYISLIGGR